MKPHFAIFAALAASSIFAIAGGTLSPLPDGWVMAGASPEQYKAGIDSAQTVSGKGAKYMGHVGGASKSWGTLMQRFSAEKYRGQRIRLQARVRTRDLSGWAGLWMRIDARNGDNLGFYNSVDQPIKGNTEWQLRSVVLDVPAEAAAIAFGVIEHGSGEVWLDDITIEPVSKSVAVNAMPRGASTLATRPTL